MNDLQSKLASLSPEQRKLLELMLQKQAQQATEPAPEPEQRSIPRRAGGEPAPLSFGQQRLWVLDQFQPGSAFYNMPLVMQLDGPLDVPTLEASLNEIARRHDVLRTTFRATTGEPVQVVAPDLRLTLARLDVEHLPEDKRRDEALRLVIEEGQRPFNLASGPLVRGTLVRLDDERHMLALILHHIIFDGWSMGVILREIIAIYPALLAKRPVPLPPLPIQYGDYAAWQRQRLQGETLEKQLAFWKGELGGKVGALELPTDRERPTVPSFTANGAKQHLHIARPLADALIALSKQDGGTLFMTLLVAYQTLLHRYSGQDTILVGSPIANRNDDDIEGMIGFFNNMLVLHGDLHGAPTFRDMLRQVRETTLRAYDHQELPFERLVEEFQPSQTMSRSPLFQVMFALQNAPRPVLKHGGLALQAINIDLGTARFDLSLSVRENEAGLVATMLYNTDLFDAPTIERMLGHYHHLLESFVATPDTPLDLLPMVGDEERQQLLAWSDEAQMYVLDAHLQLAPIGVPGTIYLGDTVQTGEQRDQTMAVPHPFREGASLYRTTRRARFRPDGTMDILTANSGGQAEKKTAPFVAPRTPIEEEIAAIWVAIIGHDRIGIHDDFFELGGHSLSAARLITRVRETFKVDLPMRRLFEATTVAAMADLIVANEQRPGQTDKIARALQRLKGASLEERRNLLEQKRRERGQA